VINRLIDNFPQLYRKQYSIYQTKLSSFAQG